MTTRKERAAARAAWPVRRTDLAGEGSGDDLSLVSTAEERLEMMGPLAEDAFPPAPTYSRQEAPGRVIRPKR